MFKTIKRLLQVTAWLSTAWFNFKTVITNNNHDKQEQKATTEVYASDMVHAPTKCDGVKHVWVRLTFRKLRIAHQKNHAEIL